MEENPQTANAIASVFTTALTYVACQQLTDQERKNACIVAALTTGVVTHMYLRKQLEKMQEIENVHAAPCKSSTEGKEAYCVVMDENAIRFDSGSDKLRQESYGTLTQVADVLKESSETLVYIEGHTDSDGSESYNQVLSEKRAISVRSLFQQKGISVARMQALGFGEKKLMVIENGDPAKKQLNRRVELRVEGA